MQAAHKALQVRERFLLSRRPQSRPAAIEIEKEEEREG